MIGPAGFDVPHFGKPAQDSPIPGANVGDYVVLGDGRGRWSSTVASRRSTRSPWRCCRTGPSGVARRSSKVGRRSDYDESAYLASHWPDTALTPLNSPPCAQLDVAAGQVPRVWLAGCPRGPPSRRRTARRTRSPATSDRDARPRPRRVRAGRHLGRDRERLHVVIDPLGKAYPLVDGTDHPGEARLRPEHGAGRARRVGRLFDEGVALSTSAALCPPANQPGEPQTSTDCRRAAVMRLALACAAALAASVLVCPAALGGRRGGGGLPRRSRSRTPPTTRPAEPSLPLLEMGVDEALARLKKQRVKPGAGRHRGGHRLGCRARRADHHRRAPVETGNKSAEPVDYHGTAVAGLIAGHREARRRPGGHRAGRADLDVQVYDEAEASTAADSTESPITVENLRLGLDAVIAAVAASWDPDREHLAGDPRRPRDPRQDRAALGLGVVVVAPTGNRSGGAAARDMPARSRAHHVRRGRRAVRPPGRLRRRARRERHAGRLEQPRTRPTG